ncbi:hypothetical protein FGM00_16290 [Aggregatimonas sangjinii]|uniref:Uncharacterized protein n=1 Tax=Aggregatimonas sangjinii TaxID=2583587 RepID=A0A5B7STR4_9FLAO|nr:hypothetical protein [Aggregatimonas sangjinii]QCX01592.1 hypothetical protein FGM00_16290 [Aggregatimonas sangjinii]
MKNSIQLISILSILVLVCACNGTSKKESPVKKEMVANDKMAGKNNKQDDFLENLKHTSPLNYSVLEAWLPKGLGGLPLDFSKPGPSLFKNSSQIIGNYLDEQSKKSILLLVLDTAGPEGNGYASKNKSYGRLKTDMEVDGMVMKSVSVGDVGAEQTYIPKKNNTQLSFAKHDRFMIKVVANNFNVEETWSFINELDFEALRNLSN